MITIEILPGLDFTNGVIAKGFRFAIRNTSARLRSMTFNILEEIGRLRCIYKIVNCIMLWPIPIPPVAAHLWEDFCQESSGTTRRAKDVIHPPAAGIGLQAPPRGPHTFVGKLQWYGLKVLCWQSKTNLRAISPGLVGSDQKVCGHEKGSILGRRHHIVSLVPDLVSSQFWAADPDDKAREMRGSPSA